MPPPPEISRAAETFCTPASLTNCLEREQEFRASYRRKAKLLSNLLTNPERYEPFF